MKKSHRRSTKVCTRCRKRKTKCDFKFPSCTACNVAGATCQGFDPVTREAVPRSLVKSLEDQVVELETQLLTYQESPDSIPYSMATIISQATISYALPSSHSSLRQDISSRLILRPSCPPLAVVRQTDVPTTDASPSVTNDKLMGISTNSRPLTKSFIDLRTIPFTAIGRMIQNYAEVLLPQYPCITETLLLDIVERTRIGEASNIESVSIYGIPAASGLGHFEYFVLFIVLAISAMTLTWKDEDQARSASESFFHSALKHHQAIGLRTEIQGLQVTLLLAHYALMCPEKVDNWTCVAKAVRIVLSLGLHALDIGGMDREQATMKADLFWVTYGMERSMCVNLRLPLSFPEEIITTKFTVPHADEDTFTFSLEQDGFSQKPSSQHICLYRSMETEVHRVLHLEEDLSKFGSTTIDGWVADLTSRLTVWYEEAQIYTQFNMLEFKVVQFYHLKARMHRPTPRLRVRGDDDRRVVLESGRILIDDYITQEHRRRLFYPWHGVHILFETAVISLEACWSMNDWHSVTSEILQMLSQSIPQCLQLLVNIGQRWNEAVVCADRLRPLANKVTAAFEDRVSRTPFPMHDAQAIAEEINGFVFSDGPLIWDQSPQTKGSLWFSDLSPSFESSMFEDLNFFEWDPEWNIMPDEPLMDGSIQMTI